MASRTLLSLNGFWAAFITTGWNEVLFTLTRETPGAFSREPMKGTGTSNMSWTSPPESEATWLGCCGMFTCHSSSR